MMTLLYTIIGLLLWVIAALIYATCSTASLYSKPTIWELILLAPVLLFSGIIAVIGAIIDIIKSARG